MEFKMSTATYRCPVPGGTYLLTEWWDGTFTAGFLPTGAYDMVALERNASRDVAVAACETHAKLSAATCGAVDVDADGRPVEVAA